MNIAEQLKKRRIELQLSQEAAANKIGISRRTLSYYESGERIPNAEILLLICNYYSLDINTLIQTDLNNEEKKDNLESYNLLVKIDEYLNNEKAKKDAFSKGIFYTALVITVVVLFVLILLVSLRFVLMIKYGYTFSEATADMWTSLFETLIQFVNDPTVKFLPLVSIWILVFMGICWGIYFLVRYLKHKE